MHCSVSTHNSKFRFYLKPIEGAVVFDEKVLQFVDGKVIAELTKEVGQMDGLHCFKDKNKVN